MCETLSASQADNDWHPRIITSCCRAVGATACNDADGGNNTVEVAEIGRSGRAAPVHVGDYLSHLQENPREMVVAQGSTVHVEARIA